MTAAEINQHPCGCYTRCGDGQWFANPHCRIHNEPKVAVERVYATPNRYVLPSGVYR